MTTFAHGVEHVAREALDVVQLGKLAPVVRRDVLLELVERLPAQVRAIHQKQHALRAPEFDQPVDGRDRRERLAAAGRHLDERAWAILRERPFKIGHGLDLRAPQPGCDQRRHVLQASAQRHRLRGPLGQRLWPVKRKHAAAARVRVEHVRKKGLDAGAFVEERQRRMPRSGNGRQAHAVLVCLRLDAGERHAFRLGLDRANDAAIHK